MISINKPSAIGEAAERAFCEVREKIYSDRIRLQEMRGIVISNLEKRLRNIPAKITIGDNLEASNIPDDFSEEIRRLAQVITPADIAQGLTYQEWSISCEDLRFDKEMLETQFKGYEQIWKELNLDETYRLSMMFQDKRDKALCSLSANLLSGIKIDKELVFASIRTQFSSSDDYILNYAHINSMKRRINDIYRSLTKGNDILLSTKAVGLFYLCRNKPDKTDRLFGDLSADLCRHFRYDLMESHIQDGLSDEADEIYGDRNETSGLL
ncbi:hypothetical protein COV93_04660 [Candidatus Woesearchaeota archaeon CG11_big_fil_rev_8_21_14_0_20_43_8]|nr:MAG: hypothetical protein COV93_04660 [Candidatus Woesearchaeota archaeon CG11_big_fil_rev_8_21_14_0_20_43_8]PIO05584.1 MAG: hypothetical protein COT47_04155 [Candidatus Woesearchaeota archaeon CG08_land_8_20_14_0_20_43_7]